MVFILSLKKERIIKKYEKKETRIIEETKRRKHKKGLKKNTTKLRRIIRIRTKSKLESYFTIFGLIG